MKTFNLLTALSLLWAFGGTPSMAQPRSDLERTFSHHTATVGEGANRVNLHYVRAGKGEPVVLLHGWPYTWFEWRHVMPLLAQRYTVIAPDLRGMGDSDKPQAGYEKRQVADDIYKLVQSLSYKQINLVGHDIGCMVAYAYAAQHPEGVKRLVLSETSGLPGFGLEETMNPATGGYWHFGFHMQDMAEALTQGRERFYIEWALRAGRHNKQGLPEEDINEYVRAYSQAGGMRGGFAHYRALLRDIEENRAGFKDKLSMPVLVMSGQYSFPREPLLKSARMVAADVREAVVPDAGHAIAAEQPEEMARQLLAFFGE
jgi:pimeloyl-ACP methyl ester carboxylesterase